jgi:SAM-dependent methyltransferase
MKLDFGSGYNALPDYKLCDVTGLPHLDYFFMPRSYDILDSDKGEPVPAGTFKEIHCRNVVHHVQDLDKLFAEFDRVLQKNGELRIIEPASEYYPINVLYDSLWYRYVTPRPEVWFSPVYRDFSRTLSKRFAVTKTREGEKDIFLCRKRGEYGEDC